MNEHFVGKMEQRTKVEELSDGSMRVETLEGRFRVIYGIHVIKTDVGPLANAPAIALEEADDFSTPEKAEFVFNTALKIVPQYTGILSDSAQKHRPLFLVDSPENTKGLLTLAPLLLAGGIAGHEIYKRRIKKQVSSMSRRKFLNILATGASVYGSGVLAEGVGSILHKTGYPNAAHNIDDVAESVDPMITRQIVKLRNLIMAQKMVGVFTDLKTKISITELPMVVGAGHINLEKELTKTSAERLKEIKEILGTDDPTALKKIMTIARMDFDDSSQKWVATLFTEPHYMESTKTR